jgi:putative Mg2+ transporter-C (MgtC) family protein
VHGLTSAASIWFTAALGVTVAASTPVLAAVALVLALIVLSQYRAGDRNGLQASRGGADRADGPESPDGAGHG